MLPKPRVALPNKFVSQSLSTAVVANTETSHVWQITSIARYDACTSDHILVRIARNYMPGGLIRLIQLGIDASLFHHEHIHS